MNVLRAAVGIINGGFPANFRMRTLGHYLPFGERGILPLERLQYSVTCRWSYVHDSALADDLV
jgi:hypothetical protein